MLSGLNEALRELNIPDDTILYVASDSTLLLREAVKKGNVCNSQDRDAFLHKFIDALKIFMGMGSTLLFPVFTWVFCKGKDFDRRNTLGEVGALNNWILQKRQDFSRTQHPMYSFMVWGREAKIFLDMDNVDAWGEDSPFAYLHHHNGKILFLNVSCQRGLTFMHYVEESMRVPYRYFKEFRSNYIDYDGTESQRRYTMYVRDLTIQSEEYLSDEMFVKAGVMRRAMWGNLELKLMDLADAFEVIKNDLLYNGGKNCYHFTGYELLW